MKKFIEELFEKNFSFDEFCREFNKFGRSNEYEIYSTFTSKDLNIRDEFEDYISSSSNIEELRKKWLNR